MTNKTALDVLMLLSALESWTLSFGKPMPDFFIERLNDVVEVLRKQVLDRGDPTPSMELQRIYDYVSFKNDLANALSVTCPASYSDATLHNVIDHLRHNGYLKVLG